MNCACSDFAFRTEANYKRKTVILALEAHHVSHVAFSRTCKYVYAANRLEKCCRTIKTSTTLTTTLTTGLMVYNIIMNL